MTAIEATLAGDTPAGGAASWRGTSGRRQVAVLTGQLLRPLIHDPMTVLMSLLQPLIILLLFSQVFRSVASTSTFPAGLTYIDYLLPAVLVTTGLGAGLQAGVTLAMDARSGLMARLRSLPVAPAAALVARSNADTVRVALQLPVLTAVAAAVFGFRPPGGIVGVLGSTALALVVAWSLGWVFLAIGVWLRDVEKMQLISTLVLFPAMFASNAYVPTANLPGWLGRLSEWNPLSHAITAARSAALGEPALADVCLALAGCGILAALGMVAAVHGLRRWRVSP